MKKLVVTILLLVMVLSVAGCGSANQPVVNEGDNPPTNAATSPSNDKKEEFYIEWVGSTFSHQFCTTVVDGGNAAADELGNVTINYNAPEDTTVLEYQLDMVNQALAQKPDALLIASNDPDAMEAQAITARDNNIPIIAVDIAWPNAPEGAVVATVATNNIQAAALAAEQLFENESFIAKLEGASAETPVVISIIAPDVVTTTHDLRIKGFAEKAFELAQTYQPGSVEITGNDKYVRTSGKDPVINIRVDVPPTKSESDLRNLSQTVLSGNGVEAVFCINEGAVSAFLSATTDGTDLDRKTGKYKDLLLIGFDSSSTLKNAVAKQYCYGAVAQDPFTMGYEALMTGIDAASGKSVKNVDIPAVWYNHQNMNEPDIAKLLYD